MPVYAFENHRPVIAATTYVAPSYNPCTTAFKTTKTGKALAAVVADARNNRLPTRRC